MYNKYVPPVKLPSFSSNPTVNRTEPSSHVLLKISLSVQSPKVCDWLREWQIEKKNKNTNGTFLILYCGLVHAALRCSSVNWRKHFVWEWTVSVVLCLPCRLLFPQSLASKGSMLDDTGKREKSLQCWDAARFRYLFKCPPAHQFFTFEDVFRVFRPSWAGVSLSREFQYHRIEGWCSEQQEPGFKTAF